MQRSRKWIAPLQSAGPLKVGKSDALYMPWQGKLEHLHASWHSPMSAARCLQRITGSTRQVRSKLHQQRCSRRCKHDFLVDQEPQHSNTATRRGMILASF
eukprot:GHRQ01014258.1.p2 GENE.GHRQ01014258.1~~GHRQ01014258.1.p2  ORF type:complete len:100 (-),score=14.26 GHRQ01014258.1:1463-1762(-)